MSEIDINCSYYKDAIKKEIIIDGIDVSECPLFDKKTGCYHTFNGECVKDSCAVYKWLLEHKRLQEENEELKERFNELYNNAEQLANKYNKYNGNKENELIEIINKTTDEKNKYKQALEEIREITNECITDCMGSKCEGMKEIQNKINEVLKCQKL